MATIEFESTPNPDALKASPGYRMGGGPPRQFDLQSPVSHPLATRLLEIDGIVRVMIARDFVTVVRRGRDISWHELRPAIALALTEAEHEDAHAASSGAAACKPLREPAGESPGEVEQHIEEVLSRYVRPLLAADGGEAVLLGFDRQKGVASIRMDGACGGCPSGATTLKATIEQAICRWVPEVKRVAAVGEQQKRNPDPKARFREWVSARWGNQS